MPIAVKVAVDVSELDHVETLIPDESLLTGLLIKLPHHARPINLKSQEVLLDEFLVPWVVQPLLH